jgi:hypothetical protein
MIKLKNIIRNYKKFRKLSLFKLDELQWAHIYHDSIRGKDFIEELPLNIGRWAGNYAFFYFLNRILSEFQPKRIVELGLGESSKFINQFLKYSYTGVEYLIFEHNEAWKQQYLKANKVVDCVEIKVCKLETKKNKGISYNSFSNFSEIIQKRKFDFYLIDGPFGSKSYSRYDAVELLSPITPQDDFLILFDDVERTGEQETVNYLLKMFKSKGINFKSKVFNSEKSICIIASEKYYRTLNF